MTKQGFAPVALVVIVLVLLAAGGGVYYWQKLQPRVYPPANNEPNQVACPADAKQCPNGSYVSRTAPNCEFAPCASSVDDTEDFLDLKELGVRLKIDGTIKDLIYRTYNSTGLTLRFSSLRLEKLDPSVSCAATNAPLGNIFRVEKSSLIKIGKETPNDHWTRTEKGWRKAVQWFDGGKMPPEAKEFENFYLGFVPSQATCSGIPAAVELQTRQRSALWRAISTAELLVTPPPVTKTENDENAIKSLILARMTDVQKAKFPQDILNLTEKYYVASKVTELQADIQNVLASSEQDQTLFVSLYKLSSLDPSTIKFVSVVVTEPTSLAEFTGSFGGLNGEGTAFLQKENGWWKIITIATKMDKS